MGPSRSPALPFGLRLVRPSLLSSRLIVRNQPLGLLRFVVLTGVSKPLNSHSLDLVDWSRSVHRSHPYRVFLDASDRFLGVRRKALLLSSSGLVVEDSDLDPETDSCPQEEEALEGLLQSRARSRTLLLLR